MKFQKQIALIFIIIFSLGACTRLGSDNSVFSTNITNPFPAPSAVAPKTGIAKTNIIDFIDAGAANKLSKKEIAEATSAQYYALQFGRVGAPRLWQGESGASGRVLVGPYVRVNSLDCRQFTHIVTIKNKAYEKKGTACREADGSWSVVK